MTPNSGVTDQHLIDDFSLRLKTIVTEQSQAMEILAADAMLSQLEQLHRPPQRRIQRCWGWIGARLAHLLPAGLRQQVYHAPSEVTAGEVIDAVYRVVTEGAVTQPGEEPDA